MKVKCLLIVFQLMATVVAFAADDLNAPLQKGLFEEEGNRNFNAAIQAYQSVVTQFDKDRQLAATAIFRLGECYRKLGKTNEAAVQYERIVNEFSDQTALATLSRQNLTGLGMKPATGPTLALSKAARLEQKRLLGEEITLAEQQMATIKKQVEVGRATRDDLIPKEREILGLRRQLAALDAGPIESPASGGTAFRERLQAIVEAAAGKEGSDASSFQQRLRAIVDRLPPGEREPTAATDEEEKEVQRIKALIKDSPDLINSPDVSGRTPLHKAAAAGQLTVGRFLLANKADVNARLTANGTATPLIVAAANGHRAMTELLGANGATIDATGTLDGKTGTALHFAAANNYKSVAEVLLALKADVNAKGSLGRPRRSLDDRDYGSFRRTPLYEATGSKPMVELLLANGAEINAQSSDGTPLHAAATMGCEPVVDFLIARKADVNASADDGTTPVASAVFRGHLKVAEALLANGADVNSKYRLDPSSPSLLHLALGSPEILKLVLAHKPDLEVQDASGLTPLQKAVLDKFNLEIVQLLLAAGVNPNALFDTTRPPVSHPTRGSGVDTKGCSPLIIAVLRDRADIVEALLANRADVNAISPDGHTALQYALEKRSLPLITAILSHRPNTEFRNSNGYTPLLTAIGSGEARIGEALIKAGADVNAALPSFGRSGQYGSSALHIAVEARQKEIVKLLLANKVEVNVMDRFGRTPLTIAQQRDPNAAPEWQTAQEELTQLLLKHGADETLPRRKTITVSRRTRGFERRLFFKGTNDYNRFSLYELIATAYGSQGFANRSSAANTTELPFPDLEHLVINRVRDGGKTTETNINLAARVAAGGCTNDLWLEWGDTVEIPETEHPLSEKWVGFKESFYQPIRECVSRKVNIVIKGRTNVLNLAAQVMASPFLGGGFGGTVAAGQAKEALFNLPSFGLKDALQGSGLLLTSSDLSRVRVRRLDPVTKKPQQRTLDITQVNSEADLWLRDGDVIEVPDK